MKDMKAVTSGAILARRVARELTTEEIRSVSGGLDGGQVSPQTDWSEDYKDKSSSGIWIEGSTNSGGDGDSRKDF